MMPQHKKQCVSVRALVSSLRIRSHSRAATNLLLEGLHLAILIDAELHRLSVKLVTCKHLLTYILKGLVFVDTLAIEEKAHASCLTLHATCEAVLLPAMVSIG